MTGINVEFTVYVHENLNKADLKDFKDRLINYLFEYFDQPKLERIDLFTFKLDKNGNWVL
jgi:hypothetical protein